MARAAQSQTWRGATISWLEAWHDELNTQFERRHATLTTAYRSKSSGQQRT
jgi:hypothetical protein